MTGPGRREPTVFLLRLGVMAKPTAVAAPAPAWVAFLPTFAPLRWVRLDGEAQPAVRLAPVAALLGVTNEGLARGLSKRRHQGLEGPATVTVSSTLLPPDPTLPPNNHNVRLIPAANLEAYLATSYRCNHHPKADASLVQQLVAWRPTSRQEVEIAAEERRAKVRATVQGILRPAAPDFPRLTRVGTDFSFNGRQIDRQAAEAWLRDISGTLGFIPSPKVAAATRTGAAGDTNVLTVTSRKRPRSLPPAAAHPPP